MAIATTIGLIVAGIFGLGLLFLIFLISRYRKFKTNEYVIRFRNGKIKSAGKGGRTFLMPIIDEIVVIPTTTQQTFLEAREKVLSREFQDIAVNAFVFWKVVKPEIAFTAVSWNDRDSDYIETIIKNAAESIIRTTCANMPLESIIRERGEIISAVSNELHDLLADMGIVVISVEIRDVEVLNKVLKTNMEATKQLQEEETAKLRKAQMEEITQLRDLEVNRKTGIQEQSVQLEIQTEAKNREIEVQKLEFTRTEVEANTLRKKITIEADAEFERMKKIADGERAKLIAKAEGEAAAVKERLVAEADGILEQVKSLAQADPKFFQLKIVEMLPEIYKQLNVDKMFVMGDGQQAFSSIAESIIPFLTVLPEITGRSFNFSKELAEETSNPTKTRKSLKEASKAKNTATKS
ncbi:MAG TPA: SPFH domain-containing protein [candidate division Zixibacteria bacterium]|nr:SPFH domain-containing protein [candidate division Zixibacteria bacterium]